MGRRSGKRGFALLALVAAAAAVVAGGCGSSSSTGTTTSATEDWAGGLCTAVDTYVGSLQKVRGTLQSDNLSVATFKEAADDVAAATTTFTSNLKILGAPGVVGSSKAKAIVEGLRTDLGTQAEAIRAATSDVSGARGVVDAVSAVGGTLASAADQVTAALTELKQLDPRGELQQAFENADSCASLTG